MIKRQRAEELLDKFKSKRILVVGDVILDRYLLGDINRISPEAPVPILNIKTEEYRAGGAGNVAVNLEGFNATAILIGISGENYYGKELSKVLLNKDQILYRDYIKTVVKTRIVAQTQQVLRIDREEKTNPLPVDEKLIIDKINSMKVDGIILSDYEKGFLTKKISLALAHKARRDKVPYLIDPKPLNFELYKECYCICPNTKEAEQLTEIKISNVQTAIEAVKRLKARSKCKTALITRGEKGMCGIDQSDEVFLIPAISHEVFDVTGAGDTVAAILLLSLASGADFREAVELANIGASVTVEKLGATNITSNEIIKRLLQNPT